jgi:hypothetical protein
VRVAASEDRTIWPVSDMLMLLVLSTGRLGYDKQHVHVYNNHTCRLPWLSAAPLVACSFESASGAAAFIATASSKLPVVRRSSLLAAGGQIRPRTGRWAQTREEDADEGAAVRRPWHRGQSSTVPWN